MDDTSRKDLFRAAALQALISRETRLPEKPIETATVADVIASQAELYASAMMRWSGVEPPPATAALGEATARVGAAKVVGEPVVKLPSIAGPSR